MREHGPQMVDILREVIEQKIFVVGVDLDLTSMVLPGEPSSLFNTLFPSRFTIDSLRLRWSFGDRPSALL